MTIDGEQRGRINDRKGRETRLVLTQLKTLALFLIRNQASRSLAICALVVLIASPAHAQKRSAKDKKDEDVPPPPQYLEYVAPRVVEMEIGLRVTAGESNMAQTIATTVFPTNWPEQTVQIVSVNVPPPLAHSFRQLPGNNQQLLFSAPTILANATVEGTVRVSIEKKHISAPTDTSIFVIPKPSKLPKELKIYLNNSPYIDANSNQVSKIAKDIAATEPRDAWTHVEKIYDWVRENIEYQQGKMKDTKETLKTKTGDCEEMSSLFIAICRASDIPARVVWIPNHCYPEFYLEDGEGHGTWFPCQAAGTRSFGMMAEYLPILQKGDNFTVPEKKERQRYLADYLTSAKITGTRAPRVEFIRRMLGDAANLRAPDPAAGGVNAGAAGQDLQGNGLPNAPGSNAAPSPVNLSPNGATAPRP